MKTTSVIELTPGRSQRHLHLCKRYRVCDALGDDESVSIQTLDRTASARKRRRPVHAIVHINGRRATVISKFKSARKGVRNQTIFGRNHGTRSCQCQWDENPRRQHWPTTRRLRHRLRHQLKGVLRDLVSPRDGATRGCESSGKKWQTAVGKSTRKLGEVQS